MFIPTRLGNKTANEADSVGSCAWGKVGGSALTLEVSLSWEWAAS